MLVLDDLQAEIIRKYIRENEEIGNILVYFNYKLLDGKNWEFTQWGKKKTEKTQNAFRYLSVETLIKAWKKVAVLSFLYKVFSTKFSSYFLWDVFEMDPTSDTQGFQLQQFPTSDTKQLHGNLFFRWNMSALLFLFARKDIENLDWGAKLESSK